MFIFPKLAALTPWSLLIHTLVFFLTNTMTFIIQPVTSYRKQDSELFHMNILVDPIWASNFLSFSTIFHIHLLSEVLWTVPTLRLSAYNHQLKLAKLDPSCLPFNKETNYASPMRNSRTHSLSPYSNSDLLYIGIAHKLLNFSNPCRVSIF